MPVYEYRGLTREGRDVGGIIDADNLKGARAKLKRIGVFPTDVYEENPTERLARRTGQPAWDFRERIRAQDIAVLTRQLATLLTAGLPVTDALSAVLDQADRLVLNKLVAEIREAVREGFSLAEALERHPRIFTSMYVQMVRAGESGGHLDEVFLRLADFLEAQVRLRDRVWAALTYPVFMFVTGALVLAVLMAAVIPRVTAMFADMHRVLPLSTRLLIAFSHFLIMQGWWIAILCGLGAVGLTRYLATPGGRALRDELFLRLPVVGRLGRIMAVSRLTRTLGTLLAGGVSLLAALEAAKRVMSNVVLERAMDQVREGVTEGKGVAMMLAQTGVIPPLVTHMVAIGEKSGDLEGMLLKASQMYDNEVESTVNGLASLLAPILVLIMGLVVLCIVTAILVPIFELSQGVR